MKTVEILDDENSLTIDDEYHSMNIKVFPETKIFKTSSSSNNDVFYSYQTYEYKISSDPIEMLVRLIEDSHEPPEKHSVKDGVVLEPEIIREGRFLGEDYIENLKKQVEWHKVELLGSYEINLFILSKHPEIISEIEYRKFLRTTGQRIETGLVKIEETLKEKDNTGLEIIEGEYGKQLWYPEEKASKDSGDYVENNFTKPLFSKESKSYCGISEYEFSESTFILKHINDLLNKKEVDISKIDDGKEEEPYRKHLSYIWTIIINLITLWVIFAIYDKMYEDFEKITASILILIYLSFQSFSMVYGKTTVENILALNTEFSRIRELLKSKPSKNEIEELKKANRKISKEMIKMYINAIFSFIIYIIALKNLFNALQ